MPDDHPIRITVADDLRRSRLTVFFRVLLAIPHLIWLALWTVAAIVAAVANWVATLVAGRSPDSLHRFLAAWIRYKTHVFAYLSLAANPYPGFTGTAGSYPIDVEIGPAERQNRWATGFRLVLAVPALVIAGGIAGVPSGGGNAQGSAEAGSEVSVMTLGGVIATVAVLGWFVCLVRGREPLGFRNLLAYGLRYLAQVDGYLLVLTDRYPNSDPADPPAETLERPIRLHVDDDLRRSRLTVFFRLLLALPHIVWLLLWSIAAFFAAIVAWFAALFGGRTPEGLHRFLAAFVRYQTHVSAYLVLVANPFPAFDGSPGRYPVDVEIAPRERQNRWITGFRLPLAVPAFVVAGALSYLVVAVAILGWFASLATGRMPRGLRNLGAYALRYDAQTYGYAFLLTDRYPFSGPPA
jgi:hypothetical protein